MKQKALDRKVEVVSENTPHASSASTEDTSVDSHPENPEDDHKAPFIDNKISYYFSAVKACREKHPLVCRQKAVGGTPLQSAPKYAIIYHIHPPDYV